MKRSRPAMKPEDREVRDRLAHHAMAICMADLSRHLSDGRMPKTDYPAAIEFIATLSYQMADAMIRARDAGK